MKTPDRPYAIAMWDFSWLERRWPGAGYEDWDKALDELAERGYDAVRIDAYPHLVAAGPETRWELLPVWNQEDWGAPALVTVQVLPGLVEFIGKARDRGIGVGLSSWFRQDRADSRMRIRTPEDLGRSWIAVLDHLEAAGLLDALLYVDLCNEFPLKTWAPYLYRDDLPAPSGANRSMNDALVADWMGRAIAVVRARHPHLAYTFSQTITAEDLAPQDVGALDFLEPHVWMAIVSDFQARIGYEFTKFDPLGYEVLVAKARHGYESDRHRYDHVLFETIDRLAAWSRANDRHLVTTEAWSLVCYKDWPGLDWDWLLDLNARAVERAAATGRWIGLCTSNFTGPQFVGVWRQVQYHRRLTDLIKASPIEPARGRG